MISNMSFSGFISENLSLILGITLSSISIKDSLFEDNHCNSVIRMKSNSYLIIKKSTFRNNTGDFGSIVYVDNAKLLATQSNFEYNLARQGGVIFSIDYIELQLIDCEFQYNVASGTNLKDEPALKNYGGSVVIGGGSAFVKNCFLMVIKLSISVELLLLFEQM